MSEQQPKRQNTIFFYAAVALYVFAGIFLIPLYKYQINPDGISYISIAQKYLHGDFANAINGHFSPLFCWLLVPVLSVGIEPLLAAKVLNLSIGIVLFFVVQLWCRQLKLSLIVQQAIMVSLIPITIYCAFHQITPDLLLTGVFFLYYSSVIKSSYRHAPREGFIAGIWGGIAYLAKSYSFPFFCIHFPVLHFFHYRQSTDPSLRKIVLRNLITGMVICCIISGIWIVLLSKKYGSFTITTQTAHNFQCVMPGSPPKYGFIKPPNDTAISVWEDPYVRIEKVSWTPFQSFSDFVHWLNFIRKNIPPMFKMFFAFSPLAFSLCIAYLVFLIIRRKSLLQEQIFIISVFTIVLYAGGYCGILIDERYIWCVLLLMITMAGRVLTIFFQQRSATMPLKNFFLMVFIFSCSYLPVKNLLASRHAGREIALLSHQIRACIPPRSTVASDGDFYTTLFIAYHLNLKYFGTTEGYNNIKAIERDIEQEGIHYFVVWDNLEEKPMYLRTFNQICEANYKNKKIKIYRKNKLVSS